MQFTIITQVGENSRYTTSHVTLQKKKKHTFECTQILVTVNLRRGKHSTKCILLLHMHCCVHLGATIVRLAFYHDLLRLLDVFKYSVVCHVWKYP